MSEAGGRMGEAGGVVSGEDHEAEEEEEDAGGEEVAPVTNCRKARRGEGEEALC